MLDMRLFRAFSPSRCPSFRISDGQGERKVVLRLRNHHADICLKSSGELVASHPLEEVSWHTCILPTREHALCLRVPAAAVCVDSAAAPTSSARSNVGELLLRSKDRERVERVQEQLCAASLELERQRQQAHRAAQQEWQGRLRCEDDGRGTAAAEAHVQLFTAGASPQPCTLQLQQEDEQPASRSDAADSDLPPLFSFGSPVAEELDGGSSGDSSAGRSGHSKEGWQDWQRGRPGSPASPQPLSAAADCVPPPRSAPASPVLPGLPLTVGPLPAPARRPSASAPVSPAHARGPRSKPSPFAAADASALFVPAHLAAPELPPVRLLSVGGHGASQPCLSHAQRLEAAVAQLAAELAQSRATRADGQSGPPHRLPAQMDIDDGTPTQTAGCCSAAGPKGAPTVTDSKPVLSNRSAAACGDGAVAAGCWAQQVEAAMRENALLLQQQAVMQAELRRMQAQLGAAAADNIRLAQEAVTAVRQLQGASEATRDSQQREAQLHSSLAAAVGQCENVKRELALLSGKLAAASGQCQGLREAVGTLSGKKVQLTAALTTLQLQLKEATPAGFAAEAAELRRQAEAARSEALQARAAAAGADSRLAEGRRREAEAAGHMREAARCMEAAHAARAAALARERQLACEVRALRQQLAGRLPDNDPVMAMQAQLEAACTGLQQERVVLVGQVHDVNATCRALEASAQAAARERDGLQVVLQEAQAARAAAERRWEEQRQQLEAGSEGSVQSAQAQVRGLQRELQAAQQRAAAREQELQSEVHLATARADAEGRAASERLDAAAAAQAAEAERRGELRARDAELAAARREVALLAAEQQCGAEEARREREEHGLLVRDLRLEASSARAEAAQMAQELQGARSGAEQLQRAVEEARRAAQQAQAQVAAAVGAHTGLSQERKELQGRLERAVVERDRAARERDAQQLKCAALQQQCRLLEAVAHGQAVLGSGARGGRAARGKRAGCKESGGGPQLWGGGEALIRAHRQLACRTGSGSD